MATILIIDDEPSIRSALARVLERQGHVVTQATDGRAALREAAGTQFELVITDIVMPEMDGIEVILQLAELCPGLPVVAISGGGLFPKELLLANADCLGAVTTLAKPFDIEEFVGAVNRALASSDLDSGTARP